MTTWNYRVMREVSPDPDGDWETYSIVEAYYDDEGRIEGTTGSIKPMGNSLLELKSDLCLMLQALERDTLDSESI